MRRKIVNEHIAMIDPTVWGKVSLWMPVFSPEVSMVGIINKVMKLVPDVISSGERSMMIDIGRADKWQLNNLNFVRANIRRKTNEDEESVGHIQWTERLFGIVDLSIIEDEETGERYTNAEVEVNFSFFNSIKYAISDPDTELTEDFILGQLYAVFGWTHPGVADAILFKAQNMTFEEGDFKGDYLRRVRRIDQ